MNTKTIPLIKFIFVILLFSCNRVLVSDIFLDPRILEYTENKEHRIDDKNLLNCFLEFNSVISDKTKSVNKYNNNKYKITKNNYTINIYYGYIAYKTVYEMEFYCHIVFFENSIQKWNMFFNDLDGGPEIILRIAPFSSPGPFKEIIYYKDGLIKYKKLEIQRIKGGWEVLKEEIVYY